PSGWFRYCLLECRKDTCGETRSRLGDRCLERRANSGRRNGVVRERSSVGLMRAIGSWTNVTEVPTAFGSGGHICDGTTIASRSCQGNVFLAPPLLGEEEESLLLARVVVVGDKDGTADGVSE